MHKCVFRVFYIPVKLSGTYIFRRSTGGGGPGLGGGQPLRLPGGPDGRGISDLYQRRNGTGVSIGRGARREKAARAAQEGDRI